MIKLSVIFCALSSLLLFSCASYKVMPISSSTDISNGMVYNLPKTSVQIGFDVETKTKTKGMYSEYANALLGLTEINTANDVAYDIKNGYIHTAPISDEHQFYLVSFKNGFCKQKQLRDILVSKENYLLSINGSGKADSSQVPVPLASPFAQQPSYVGNTWIEKNTKERIDTISEFIQMDTLRVEKKVVKKTYEEKSAAQKAKEAADFLLKVKQDQYQLLNGYAEVNYSAQTLSYMIDELKKLEKEYLALFIGEERIETTHHTYYYVPSDTIENNDIPLFSYLGKNQEDTLVVALHIKKLPSLSGNTSPEVFAKQKGIVYRIPAYALVSITNDRATLTEKKVFINQFGRLNKWKWNRQAIELNPTTGNMERVYTK